MLRREAQHGESGGDRPNSSSGCGGVDKGSTRWGERRPSPTLAWAAVESTRATHRGENSGDNPQPYLDMRWSLGGRHKVGRAVVKVPNDGRVTGHPVQEKER
jgi:hypothetical protein